MATKNTSENNYSSGKVIMNHIMYSVIFRLNNIISKWKELQELHDSDIDNKADTTEKSL